MTAATAQGWAADSSLAPSPSAVTPAESVAQRWSATFTSEFRYYSWKSDRGYPPGSSSADFRGTGSEIYIPYALQLVGLPNDNVKIEILGRGGWVRARQSTANKSGEVETTTDTQVSATATFVGFNGAQPFVSINFNIPTGKSALYGSAANARMDGDLVDIASFGEGFNIGPTVGVNIPITNNLIATWSIGYTQRGTFTREGSLSPSAPTVQAAVQLDPGDVVTGTASLGYQEGQFSGQITGAISTETDTKEGGSALFRAGMRYLASAAASFTWPEKWGVTTLAASTSHARKNKALFLNAATLDPVRYDIEPFNSNSNLYRVALEHLFPFGQLWVGPTASFLYRDRNGYDSQTLQFVPAKERWSAGLTARVAASEKITFNARAEHVWTYSYDNSGGAKTSLLLVPPNAIPVESVPPISSTGWQVFIGANINF